MTKLKLNCYVRGDDSLDTFSVNIDEDDDVSYLRHAIKEKKRNSNGAIFPITIYAYGRLPFPIIKTSKDQSMRSV